jgi:hypothetical protein
VNGRQERTPRKYDMRKLYSNDNPTSSMDKFLKHLAGVRKRGDGYMALCPSHDDREPSLSVCEGDDGRVLLKCFAGCRVEDIVSALGLHMRDLFSQEKKAPSTPPNATATLQPCHMESYAEAKGLPVEFLKRLGLSDRIYQGREAVRIPYLNENGEVKAVRSRIFLRGDSRFRWREGDKAMLYGLWRLEGIRRAGYVVLVEGESDAQTLWHHEIPALGIPGANTWRNEWSEFFEAVAKIYAVVEPDSGGEALWEGLAGSPVRERLYQVELEGATDASELHLQDPEQFVPRIKKALAHAVAWRDLAATEASERAREAWGACEALAHAEDILERFADGLARSGVAGESRVAKLLYLAITSRLLERPVSVAVKGPSSGGKSYLTEQVLRFFPESAYYALTAMSERTLAYSEEPIKHRFLVLYEAAGMSGEFATYLIRSLLSEGRVRYETVEKTSEGMKPRLIEREGPTGLIVTTTAVKLHPENETRLLSLPVTDTQEQTHDILVALAKEAGEVSPNLEEWHALQQWLQHAEKRVTMPFAIRLATLIPPVAVRLRRDVGAVFNLIRAHAILHQASRERDPKGRIVATLEDYAAVRGLVADLVSEGVEATVPATIRETVEELKSLHDDEKEAITIAKLAEELKLDNSTAWRRVRTAIDRGYAKNLEDRKGRPARLVPGDDLPDDIEILPAVARLQGCSDFGGDKEDKVSGEETEDRIQSVEEVFELAREYFGLIREGFPEEHLQGSDEPEQSAL